MTGSSRAGGRDDLACARRSCTGFPWPRGEPAVPDSWPGRIPSAASSSAAPRPLTPRSPALTAPGQRRSDPVPEPVALVRIRHHETPHQSRRRPPPPGLYQRSGARESVGARPDRERAGPLPRLTAHPCQSRMQLPATVCIGLNLPAACCAPASATLSMPSRCPQRSAQQAGDRGCPGTTQPTRHRPLAGAEASGDQMQPGHGLFRRFRPASASGRGRHAPRDAQRRLSAKPARSP
jgi:hypothetical protein